jgi:hypothetical protein
MKNSIVQILILLFLLGSCAKVENTDHSLSLEEYARLGMPDHSRVWDVNDYSYAFFVLNTLKVQNPEALPSRNSERSAVLFQHMISTENLSFLEDESLPLWTRADMIKWFVNTLMELKVAYTLIGVEKQYYAEELMDIDIFRITVLHEMLALGQRINESENPSDVAMQADFHHIQQMYVDLILELLDEQQKTSQYPMTSLERLSDSISLSVRSNLYWLDKESKGAMEDAIGRVMEHTTSRKIRSDYGEITELLQKD